MSSHYGGSTSQPVFSIAVIAPTDSSTDHVIPAAPTPDPSPIGRGYNSIGFRFESAAYQSFPGNSQASVSLFA